MTVETRAEVKAPTWHEWEVFASTEPQPESRLLIQRPASFTLERYTDKSGEYLVAWIQHGSGMFGLQLLMSDVEWYGRSKAVFLGAVQDDSGEATEMVWFSAR